MAGIRAKVHKSDPGDEVPASRYGWGGAWFNSPNQVS